MGRLIDADELIEIVQGTEELLDFQKDELIVCVDACDIAYDLDKVIAKLEEQLTFYSNNSKSEEVNEKVRNFYMWTGLGMKNALDIVRSGGKE